MKDLVKIFKKDGFEIRSIEKDGQPWFVAKDVCEALEITDHNDAISRLDDDEKSGAGITDPHGREQITNIINESGLYSLIFKSRKTSARKFKKWVTNEVLPTIRKTGKFEIKKKINHCDQLSIPHQIQNSKIVNAVNLENGGVNLVRDYNRQSARIHTGFTPAQLKRMAKADGEKSSVYNSGKNVIRKKWPHKACAISLQDECVSQGVSFDLASRIGIMSQQTFQLMIQAGLQPGELESK